MCAEVFTSSFVSCKTQHCVIEFGETGPRGPQVATGLIEREAAWRKLTTLEARGTCGLFTVREANLGG